MRHLGLWAAFALSAIVALLSWPALADDKSCAEYRENIIRMERESVRPPGWYGLDRYLRLAYVADCIKNPTAQRAPEYWYRIDGSPTGIPSTSDRPTDGAYTATADIASTCMGTTNPSMCAMMTGLTRSCASPTNDQERYMCWLLLGDPGSPPAPVPASAELPPLSVTLDGKTYALPKSCERAVNALNSGLAEDQSPSAAGQRASYRNGMAESCPELLAALERRLGVSAQNDPSRFWPALEGLALSGFAPPGTNPTSLDGIQSDPGFQRMCREADANWNICTQRQNNMRSIGSDPVGTAGQAGAFNSCRILYGQVLAMCNPKNHAALTAPKSVPKPAPMPSPKADRNAPQASSAPPKPAAPAMSPQCQQLVSNYVAASQANDGPKALTGYNALKQAGGCGVLAKVDKPMPAAGAPSVDDSRFSARRPTTLSDQVVGGCDASPDVCAARVQQLKAGTSPEAVAALWTHAIGVGLELGGAMVQAGAGIAAQRGPSGGGSNTNMNSMGNPPVRSTHGQGSPSGPPRGFTPYGDGLHEGTAR